MIYTDKIQKAIKFSIKTHQIYQQQKRKGKDIPYIVHPLAVGLILAAAGAKEEVIIAGILHDTIEDSIKTKKVTQTMLGERFNHIVAELVVSVTEKNKDLDWETRKKLALDDVASFSQESVMLKSADVIQNSNELLADIAKDGDEVFHKFHAPEPQKPKILHHQILLINTLLEKWPENPLKEDLEELKTKLLNLK